MVIRLVLAVFIFISVSIPAFAIHSDLENGESLRPSLVALGVVTTTYIVSEMEDGPALFAGIYAMGSLYLLREKYSEGETLDELGVPFALITLAVANAALLSDEDEYDHNEVFVFNLAGLGLISAYAIWQHANLTPGQLRREREAHSFRLEPWLTKDSSGFLLSRNF